MEAGRSQSINLIEVLTSLRNVRSVLFFPDVTMQKFPFLILTLTAMSGSAHTIFKSLELKKSLNAKNQQKLSIPRKTSAESMS
jgi:hypothetical protein